MSTREAIVRRGIHLEYFGLAWNLLEAGGALAFGVLAGSIALFGFGLDSLIEMVSGSVLLWRLHADVRAEDRERNERRALQLVGTSFLALSAYITFDAIRDLIAHEVPRQTIPGIVLTAVSVLVMIFLARAKRSVARGIESEAMRADSRQADFCAYISVIVLLGLILNAAFGWWWADAAAALVMVPLIANEGVEALRGKDCCAT